jgi:Tfp pilus assembly protein PilZ
MAGYRSILRFKPRERLHLAGTHSLGSAQFIASKIVALANLLLDRALNVAKRVFWIAPARTDERVPQEP